MSAKPYEVIKADLLIDEEKGAKKTLDNTIAPNPRFFQALTKGNKCPPSRDAGENCLNEFVPYRYRTYQSVL